MAELQDDGQAELAQAAWNQLPEVVRLDITVIVDNLTDGMSAPCACCDPTNPSSMANYISEFGFLTRAFMNGQLDDNGIDVSRMLMAGHGLSVLLTAQIADGGGRSSIIVDGGPRTDLWAANACSLGIDLSTVQGAVLTHWHPDHSVGLAQVARAASAGPRAEQAFVFDVHPDRPHRRGIRVPSNTGDRDAPFNMDVSLADLEVPPCCRVEQHSEPHVMGDAFFVSGRIPRTTRFEMGQAGHVVQHVPGGAFELDPWIWDERCVAVKIKGRGAVVVTGCSHAGVANVVRHITALAAGDSREGPLGRPARVVGLVGGLHLAGRGNEDRIPATVADLAKTLDPAAVVLAGHCTGWRAHTALANAFPAGYQPCVVGGRYSFVAAD